MTVLNVHRLCFHLLQAVPHLGAATCVFLDQSLTPLREKQANNNQFSRLFKHNENRENASVESAP